MIVTFSTTTSGSIVYQGDIALQLLRILGRDETMPSAMYAEDIPSAVATLKAAIALDRSREVTGNADDDSSDAEVSLSHRALPLIELLEAAQRENTGLMWSAD